MSNPGPSGPTNGTVSPTNPLEFTGWAKFLPSWIPGGCSSPFPAHHAATISWMVADAGGAGKMTAAAEKTRAAIATNTRFMATPDEGDTESPCADAASLLARLRPGNGPPRGCSPNLRRHRCRGCGSCSDLGVRVPGWAHELEEERD